jgi:hypothetical protein
MHSSTVASKRIGVKGPFSAVSFGSGYPMSSSSNCTHRLL